MASAVPLADLVRGFNQLTGRSKLGTMFALALLVSLGVGSWLWGSSPDYRVLYSNVGDRDGGAIVAALAQMNVPYRMSESGGAIMVPATQVHETRLRLASQGLPRGGVVGFELMENQKLGATQFQEQVNYQRALEGELARSVQTLAAVASARVHLAIPKPSVFLRDQQRPSASVIVNLNAGRALDRAQIAGIAHLIAAAVPELPLKSVSVLDQNGNLLSVGHDAPGGLDAGQLGYVQQIEAATIKRVTDILEPIVGRTNLRVQVTAELDFSQTESTAETYKPNQSTEHAVVRSEQKTETSDATAGGMQGAQGVPGAASNQPPGSGAAPGAKTAPQSGAAPQSLHRETSVNYEVDKTVRHVKSPVGATKRLSAAVAVNYKKGKPYSAQELEQITALAKDAMGYTQARGDSINVVNAPFSANEPETAPEPALWQQPENVAFAREAAKGLAVVAVFLYLLFGVLRPLVRSISAAPAAEPQAQLLPAEIGGEAASYEQRIAAAKQLAKSDPRVVANVVKSWVSSNE
jgi:flagellar M-ring protein FliF